MSYLFNDQTLSDYFEATVIYNIKKDIEDLPENQLLASSDDEIIDHIFSKYEIIPLQIFENEMSSESNDIKVRYRDDNREYDGIKFRVELPFTGDSQLWHLRPSTYVSNFPEGSVVCKCNREGMGILVFDIGVELNQNIDASNKQVEGNLKYIKLFIDYQRVDIERLNADIKTVAKNHIHIRREKLKKKEAVIKAFKVPLRRSANAPDVINIPIKRKLIKPLPCAPDKPLEYGISDDDYKHILGVIRHEGATFETIPKIFAIHNEEDLRSIILAHLNGHYLGDATGETFRGIGKTDIRIEFKNRAAFVSECKVWRGEKEISEAIDQLTGYLTWRDCKIAIIIFNKDVKGFPEIQGKVPEVFRTHKSYLQTVSNQPAGEWRYVFKSKDDEDRHVTIHVFLFNLYVTKNN